MEHRFCKFPGCKENRTQGSYYCDQHICLKPACRSGVSRDGLQLSCEDHVCEAFIALPQNSTHKSSSKGSQPKRSSMRCQEPQERADSVYCEAHACKFEGCSQTRTSGEGQSVKAEACTRHLCSHPGGSAWRNGAVLEGASRCWKVRMQGGGFCDRHTCSYTNHADGQRCLNEAERLKYACTDHLCEVDFQLNKTSNPCPYPQVAPTSFCDEHLCRFPKCEEQVDEAGWFVCKNHVCVKRKCFKMRRDTSTMYCESCGCRDCPNPKVSGAGYCDIHLCQAEKWSDGRQAWERCARRAVTTSQEFSVCELHVNYRGRVKFVACIVA
ncbi:hypothetical protein QBC47DRAFT_165768 [Echria macrotheca]|uniref:Uncharacterized protein n=1 Tax=Echria macrotheca TaxID=438768 RepID=A0AAJ0BGI0_9PEZI|nr:hypothetical protein QBC47DRAFT_165768 [Echria macrotheca]